MIIKVLVENSTKDPCLQAEHGLSLYMECGPHRILFDMGQTDAFRKNAEKMGVDLTKVDCAVLSHGHYDHGGGLRAFLQVNDHAPIYVHKRAFEPPLSRSAEVYRPALFVTGAPPVARNGWYPIYCRWDNALWRYTGPLPASGGTLWAQPYGKRRAHTRRFRP